MLDEKQLDKRLGALESARAWGPRVVSKLESHLRLASDEALFRINPLTFAKEKGLAETEAVDLFIHAAAAGLFRIDWLLLCPKCSCVVESFHTLGGVDEGYHCHLCQMDYEAVLDEFIAVTFTVAPELRPIGFHRPASLSPADRVFKISGTPDGRLPDGRPFIELQQSVTRAVVDLPPGELTRVEVELEEGTLVAHSLESRLAFAAPIEGPRSPAPQRIEAVFGEKVRQLELKRVAPGRVTIEVQNTSSARGTLWVVVLPPGVQVGEAPISFVPFLNGKRLLTTQAFRDLFQSELIRATAGIGIRDMTLLFTDLKGSTEMYDEMGDLNAFALVQQHFDRLQQVTVRHGGAVVKTIGDAVMATFPEPAMGLQAAIEMIDEIDRFNRARSDRPLGLKVGLHRGPSIAVTLNGRVDYFGQAVNIAARVQALAKGGEICLTEEVRESPGTAKLLEGLFKVEPELAQLKGVQHDMRVLRVTPRSC